MLTPSVFSCSFSFFFVVHFPIESGRNEAITTEGQEINNWTKVSAILWYRSTKIIALKGNYQGEQLITRLMTEPVALEPRLRNRLAFRGALPVQKFEEPTDLNGKPGEAKPRDLRFCGPFLEMFFDRALMQVQVKVPRLRRSDNVGKSMPQPWPGWADVWRSALRASRPRPLPRKTFPGKVRRTADPSAALGMTRGGRRFHQGLKTPRINRRSLHCAALLKQNGQHPTIEKANLDKCVPGVA
jgi:hypothetical protein